MGVRLYLLCLTGFLMICAPVAAHRQLVKPYVILNGYEAGMFAHFDQVLVLTHGFDSGFFTGCKVDFETTGFYYDSAFGPNWWDYFCEPISLGERSKRVLKTMSVMRLRGCQHAEHQIKRNECAEIVKKHIRIKPIFEEKVDTFVNHQFQNDFVIGIHYRGTDKHVEAPRVAYEHVLLAINLTIQKLALRNGAYRLFIATDEWALIDYLESLFPGRVCYYQDAPRSTDHQPVHMNTSYSGYAKGESALIDCLLLSRCDFLIRSSSNLSRWSTYFNPDLPVFELNQRHQG